MKGLERDADVCPTPRIVALLSVASEIGERDGDVGPAQAASMAGLADS